MPSFLADVPIDPGALLRQVAAAGNGGTALFVGTVRDHHGDRAVAGLDYSAYPAMAEREATAILDEARLRWSVLAVASHRTGALTVGEVAIVVAVGSAHRDAAFTACRWIVDELKRRVPIWKREHFADGSVSWVDPTEPATGSTP